MNKGFTSPENAHDPSRIRTCQLPTLWGRLSQSLRWRLGLSVAAPELEAADDESVARFYRNRETRCEFFDDPTHYEYPRAQWVLKNLRAGRILEIGCGNGGMTRLLAPKVERLVALDVSTPSVRAISELELPNVVTVECLVEHYSSHEHFDCIVMSEVLEHLREPKEVLRRCARLLKPGGRLLVTTPNGHWESNEHLQEFSMGSFARLFAGESTFETLCLAYLRDPNGRRRWLTANVEVPSAAPTPDSFNDRRAVRRARRRTRT